MSRASRGFSLVELMVTIVVVAILAGIALPNFRSFMQRNAVRSTASSVMADLQYARSQAVAQSGDSLTYVSMCPSADGASCSAGSENFDKGWLLYTDTKANDTYSDDASHQILRVGQPSDNVSIRTDRGGVLTYNARGELVISSVDAVNFLICSKARSGSTGVGTNTGSVRGQRVDAAVSGRVSVRELATGDACESG